MLVSLNKTTRYLFLAVMAIGISACGFQLRGNVDIPEALQTLTLVSDVDSQDFDIALRTTLKRSDITIVKAEDAAEGTLELKINPLETKDIVLARNDENETTQIQRRLTATYFIRQEDGKSLYGPRSVNTSRVLANQNAEQSTRAAYNDQQNKEMSEDLARQLIYDLSYAPIQ
ncbi:MAG: LPS-assembly lipoprotein LptE [Marinomonas sp.]